LIKQPALILTTLLATTLALNTNVYADEQSDKQEIIKAYRAINTAIEQKNINQLFANYAPDFTIIRIDGRLTNLEKERQETQRNFQNIRQINVHDDIKEIKINGQKAKVVGIGYSTLIISDPRNNQVSIPFAMVSKYQDIWKRRKNKWKLISTHILELNTAIVQQASHVSRQKLTPQEEQLINQQEMMKLQNMLENMGMQLNMINCINNFGYQCGNSPITP
jgi:hypothetical protein